MPKYAVLMRENDDSWARMPREEQERLLKRYLAWVAELRAKAIFRDGEPLDCGGRILRMVDGEIMDRPFTETKEVLTGFFIIEAPDLDAAARIARAARRSGTARRWSSGRSGTCSPRRPVELLQRPSPRSVTSASASAAYSSGRL